jgi:hypothetical protein
VKPIKDMKLEELRYQARKVDWDKVPNYNQIDWMNDSIEIIKAKLEKVIKEYRK